MFMFFSFIIQCTLGYYYTFFPIYYSEMGADNSLLGWAMFLSALSEIPFLLFADKIINRFGIKKVLLSTAFFAGVRWLLLYLVDNPYIVLPIQMFHGVIFIVLMVTIAMYINKEVPKELKASGQTMYGLISMGIARIVGSILGGVTSDYIGMAEVFLYNSIIAFLTLIIFIYIFSREANNNKNIF
jgi:MFS transporter, PPP family, 3-phenylpropionic acid transporter